MTRLLAATDFSADAQFALDRAGQLARAWNAELDLLHVPAHGLWPQGAGMLSKYLGTGNLASLEEDEQRLAGLAAALSRRFRIKAAIHVVPGRAAQEIAAFATAREADMVVMAVRGQGRTRAGAVGGTALKVLWQSLVPVLLVRTPAETAYRRVMLATDLSDRSLEGGRRVAAQWPKAGLSIVHAFRGEYETALELAGTSAAMLREYRADQALLAAEGLAQFWKQMRGDSRRRAAEFLVQGHPVPGVLKAAAELKPDLVVLGRHAGPRWEERILGSVAQNLIQQLKTDTLMLA
jgi:nucleotide-binding universal stress UspA family protein